MFFRNLSDKQILKDSLCLPPEKESEFVSCNLDGLEFKNPIWEEMEFSSCNINEVLFYNSRINKVSFIHSSLMRSSFLGGIIRNSFFSGTTLIKTEWKDLRIKQLNVFQCTMQKMQMKKCIIENSKFSDFEGIYSDISDCIFFNCQFEVTYGGGMNGFSGASFKNCIFLNCAFSGFPLRGVNTESCVFSNCFGEITDEAECYNTVGLEKFCKNVQGMKINNKETALSFVNEWM